MFLFLKNSSFPIGIDIGDDGLKLVQLCRNGNNINIISGGSKNRPDYIKAGSGDWQRWAISAIREVIANSKFRGRDIIAAMPASEVFIDHVKIPPSMMKKSNDKLPASVSTRIKQKLPFELEDAMIKYIPTEENYVLVIAAERKRIDRHLAIYENSNLKIKSIAVWPTAMTNCYTQFFGRRKDDIEATVMLLDIETNYTKVVVCRHKNLLFARSIPIGVKQLEVNEENCKNEEEYLGKQMITRLVLELTACRRQFESMQRKAQIERLIFLSGRSVDRELCTTIAKQLKIPAQVGDCLVAVEISNPNDSGIDRRDSMVNWATAFGLSLSLEKDDE